MLLYVCVVGVTGYERKCVGSREVREAANGTNHAGRMAERSSRVSMIMPTAGVPNVTLIAMGGLCFTVPDGRGVQSSFHSIAREKS